MGFAGTLPELSQWTLQPCVLEVFYNTPFRELEPILYSILNLRTVLYGEIVWGGWTNVNLWYIPTSIEIASLKGLSLCCPEINQSKQLLA